ALKAIETTQADLEERLMFALDDRDTASRHLETMKEEMDRAKDELVTQKKALAAGQETLTRLSLALSQLDALERDANALRTEALQYEDFRDLTDLTSFKPPAPKLSERPNDSLNVPIGTPSNRPTPSRIAVVPAIVPSDAPAVAPSIPPHPLSDPEIRISIEEE